MIIKVLNNQSFLDIAVQHTGSVINAFPIAVANNMSVSEELIPGTVLQVPESVEYDTEIKDYYQSKGLKPASKIEDEKIAIIPLSGINYWIIEENFIVE